VWGAAEAVVDDVVEPLGPVLVGTVVVVEAVVVPVLDPDVEDFAPLPAGVVGVVVVVVVVTVGACPADFRIDCAWAIAWSMASMLL